MLTIKSIIMYFNYMLMLTIYFVTLQVVTQSPHLMASKDNSNNNNSICTQN